MTSKPEDWVDDPQSAETIAELRDELVEIRARHADDPPMALLRAAREGVLPVEVQAIAAQYLADHPHTETLLDDEDLPPLSPADEDRLLQGIRQRLGETADAADLSPASIARPLPFTPRRRWARVVIVGGAIAAGVLLTLVIRPRSDPGSATAPSSTPPARTAGPTEPTTGDRDHIQDGPRLLSILADGRVGGLETVPDAYKAAIGSAMSNRRLETAPAIQALLTKNGTLLGSVDTAQDVHPTVPVGIAVESRRPAFTWNGTEAATYQVSVFDDAYNPVVESEWLTATTWTPAVDLARNRGYSWQIRVRRGGNESIAPAPPAPEARFRVIADDELRDVEAVRQGEPSAHLLLAVVYARLGLFDDAERELIATRDANPSSTVPSQLLADLSRLRGR